MSSGRIDYFYFKGRKYGPGTIVKFREPFKSDVLYGKYMYGALFEKMETPETKYSRSINTTFAESSEIEAIIVPVLYGSIPDVKICKDTECNDMFYAWVLYIVGMLFISITTSRYLGWIVITIIFWQYRRSKLYRKKSDNE